MNHEKSSKKKKGKILPFPLALEAISARFPESMSVRKAFEAGIIGISRLAIHIVDFGEMS